MDQDLKATLSRIAEALDRLAPANLPTADIANELAPELKDAARYEMAKRIAVDSAVEIAYDLMREKLLSMSEEELVKRLMRYMVTYS